MKWHNFTKIREGKRIVNHLYDQCVAVANQYHEGVLGLPFVPVNSAFQWWTDFGRYAALHENYRRSSRPVAGAVIVWSSNFLGDWNGHIGVVLSVNGDGTITTLEQNVSATKRWTHRYRRPQAMPGLLGYLIPHKNPAAKKPTIVDKIKALFTSEEDDEMKPTIHIRTEGNFEATRAHPEIGRDLRAGQSRADGNVVVFRGFEVTANRAVATAWARTSAQGTGKETSRTNRAGYMEIQRQAQRLSLELA